MRLHGFTLKHTRKRGLGPTVVRRVRIQALGMAVAGLLGAAAPAPARVNPDPNSLLATKKVLVINGTETSGDHRDARLALMNRLRALRTEIGFQLDSATGTTTPTTFAGLDAYDIIFWNYWFNSAQTLNPTANFTSFQDAFKQWTYSTNKTRGWIGVHSSAANEVNEWNWFRDSVSVMRYFVHSAAAQTGKTFRSPDPAVRALPVMQGLDSVFTSQDEWYDFDYPPLWGDTANWNVNANVRVLYYLDESTLATAPAHKMNPHPMAWTRESPLGNRFFYTSFIHTPAGANSDFMHSLLLRALEYAAGYSSTSITVDGRNLGVSAGPALVRGGEIVVNAAEPYRLGIYSLQGKRVFQASGSGKRAYRPAAFKTPGVYVVRIAAPSGGFSQKMIVE